MLAGLSQNVLERAGQIMTLLKERDADLSETFGRKDFVNHKNSAVNKKSRKDPEKKSNYIEPSLFD
jgi:hypothetical protein